MEGEAPPPAALRAVVDDYVIALFGQISQAAACNRLHSNEQRLSRWLLMSRDRVGVNVFAITHEFLASMLGARRATVSLSAGDLQAAGLIRYHCGQVVIVDRAGLEGAACECYRAIQRSLDGVVQSVAPLPTRPAPMIFSAQIDLARSCVLGAASGHPDLSRAPG